MKKLLTRRSVRSKISSSETCLLSSNYLIDVYPSPILSSPSTSSWLKRDMCFKVSIINGGFLGRALSPIHLLTLEYFFFLSFQEFY